MISSALRRCPYGEDIHIKYQTQHECSGASASAKNVSIFALLLKDKKQIAYRGLSSSDK